MYVLYWSSSINSTNCARTNQRQLLLPHGSTLCRLIALTATALRPQSGGGVLPDVLRTRSARNKDLDSINMAAAVERAACVVAAHRLHDAVLRYPRFPIGFDSMALRDTVRGCLPCQLLCDASTTCHSKVLGVASAMDGSYAAYYRVDAAKLARGEFAYGCDLRFTLGVPGRWLVMEENPNDDDTPRIGNSEAARLDHASVEHMVAYEWVGEWDVRQRPWLADRTTGCCSRSRGGAWTRPYADPMTNDLLESYVVPLLMPMRGGRRRAAEEEEVVVGVVLAGTFPVASA
jgi:hypothetical protein